MPSNSSHRLKLSKEDLHVSKKRHWDGKQKGFFFAVGMSFCTLQLLFLGVMSLLYGSQFKDEKRVSNLPVLAIDYDGGLVGQALNRSYGELQGNTFPTLHFEPNSSYPDVQSLKDIVCNGKYWAAVYTWPGASERLSNALEGGQDATSFNSSDMISFIWLEARYPTVSEGDIAANLNQLIDTSAVVLHKLNGTQSLASLNQSDSAAVQAYLNPIIPSSINLMPTDHGTRVLYNTASVAVSIIQMFFFILAINGVSGAMSLFTRLTVLTNMIVRQGLAATYTLIAALLEVSYIWAFKESWDVKGYMFVLLWMVTWLHMWVNFMVIDAATGFVPLQFMTYIVISYVIINITSSLVCIPVAAHFYRYAYAMPSHNWYEAFITITTGGCVNTLYRSLPILFSWFLLGQLASTVAMTNRCRTAVEEEKAAAAMSAQQPVMEEKADDDDTEAGLSRTLSPANTDHDADSETTLHRRPSSATLPDRSSHNSYQRTSAYYPSIPFEFEGFERVFSGPIWNTNNMI